MPMGYESLVGDMSSTLSGGQKQRVLLARVIYARLCSFMSPVDVATEGGCMVMRVSQVWRSASASRKRWMVFWLSFLVLQVFTGSKVGVVATGGIFLLQLVMLFREAKEKGTGDG
jgi:hypothetical protein